MNRSCGFNLIELLVVMASVAALAALATPSYSRYVVRSRRAQARQALAAIAQAQERWYATYHRYTDDLDKLGYNHALVWQHDYYAMSLSMADEAGQAFVATATPIGRQSNDACGGLSIDQAGRKLPDKLDIKANTNGRCW